MKIAIDNLLVADMGSEQRVGKNSIAAPLQIAQLGQPIERITTAPPIMKTRDPTAKRNLIKTTCTHQRKTRQNTPGALPAITRVVPTVIAPETKPRNRRTNELHAQACNFSTALSGT